MPGGVEELKKRNRSEIDKITDFCLRPATTDRYPVDADYHSRVMPTSDLFAPVIILDTYRCRMRCEFDKMALVVARCHYKKGS